MLVLRELKQFLFTCIFFQTVIIYASNFLRAATNGSSFLSCSSDVRTSFTWDFCSCLCIQKAQQQLYSGHHIKVYAFSTAIFIVSVYQKTSSDLKLFIQVQMANFRTHCSFIIVLRDYANK